LKRGWHDAHRLVLSREESSHKRQKQHGASTDGASGSPGRRVVRLTRDVGGNGSSPSTAARDDTAPVFTVTFNGGNARDRDACPPSAPPRFPPPGIAGSFGAAQLMMQMVAMHQMHTSAAGAESGWEGAGGEVAAGGWEGGGGKGAHGEARVFKVSQFQRGFIFKANAQTVDEVKFRNLFGTSESARG